MTTRTHKHQYQHGWHGVSIKGSNPSQRKGMNCMFAICQGLNAKCRLCGHALLHDKEQTQPKQVADPLATITVVDN